jgi:hypothetical protein
VEPEGNWRLLGLVRHLSEPRKRMELKQHLLEPVRVELQVEPERHLEPFWQVRIG